MPPKQKASKKTREKAKARTVEDKTFGLKNKKGAKQQKFIEQVNKQVYKGNPKNDRAKAQQVSKKAQKQAYLDELDSILNPIKDERKVIMSKKQQEEDKDKEVVYLTIEELVEVERLKLKNSKKKLTPVTLASFLEWKTKKKAEEKKLAEEEAKKKAKYAKEGKIITTTGKELFAYYKDKIVDDEEAGDIDYNERDSDYEEDTDQVKEITAATFYYEGVDAAINEELFADEDLDALDALCVE